MIYFLVVDAVSGKVVMEPTMDIPYIYHSELQCSHYYPAGVDNNHPVQIRLVPVVLTEVKEKY